MNYYNRTDNLTIQEENDRDMERFKEFYPRNMRRLQELIEDECDKLEYQGSRMFDEYPDKNMLRSLSHKICDRAKAVGDFESEVTFQTSEKESVSAIAVMQQPYGRRPPQRPPRRPNQPDLLEDIIQVLLFNEIARRRCRYRNCRYNIF